MEASGKPFCVGPQYLNEILFKVKKILLSVSCKYVIIILLLLSIFMIIDIKYVKPALTRGRTFMTVEVTSLSRALGRRPLCPPLNSVLHAVKRTGKIVKNNHEMEAPPIPIRANVTAVWNSCSRTQPLITDRS